MAKYIVTHRRGTSKQWAETKTKLYEGEIGIEYSDDEQSEARILIGTKNGRNALPFQPVSKIRMISLPSDKWVGDISPFSQEVIIKGITQNSKVDLQPTAELLAYLSDEEITLTTSNSDGFIQVHAINNKPSIDITIQCVITEVIE